MPVMVYAVTPRDGAQASQIEMRVLDLQRIKGPFQQLNSFFDGIIALRQLQSPPQAVVAVALPHCQHVRMEIGMPCPAAWNGKRKPDEFAAIERANDLPANFLTHNKHAQRNQINIVKPPDLFLQGNAGIEFIHAVAFSNGNLFGPGDGRAHFLVSSSALACCHRASISSNVACSSVRPCWRNCSSSQPKRRRNFLLVLRKAASGSTER